MTALKVFPLKTHTHAHKHKIALIQHGQDGCQITCTDLSPCR